MNTYAKFYETLFKSILYFYSFMLIMIILFVLTLLLLSSYFPLIGLLHFSVPLIERIKKEYNIYNLRKRWCCANGGLWIPWSKLAVGFLILLIFFINIYCLLNNKKCSKKTFWLQSRTPRTPFKGIGGLKHLFHNLTIYIAFTEIQDAFYRLQKF